MRALLIAEKHSLKEQIRSAYNKYKNELEFEIDFYNLHGHVLKLMQPRDLNAKYQKWNLNDYPVTFDYVYTVKSGDNPLVRELKELLKKPYDFIIHAGDPDQEGQLLVDELLLFLKNKLPVQRFWTNDTTDIGIIHALKNLRPNSEYIGFYEAALLRSHLDYQFGMNLTVASTVKFAPYKVIYRLGRVKAALISLITERENQIKNFVPKTSYKKAFKYREDEFVNNTEYDTKDFVLPTSAIVKEVSYSEKDHKAPKLFKLSSLQSEAYKQFGWSSSKTLDILQGLYEAKLVSYPRTDCEYLSTNIDLVRILGRDYPKTDKDYFNDKKIASEGHTAIIPTGENPGALTGDDRKLYELINRRFRAIFAPVKRTKTVKVIAVANNEDYKWSYTWNLQDGYELVLNPTYTAPTPYIERYSKNMTLSPIQGFAKECTTKPPARYNEGSIVEKLDFETEVDGEKIQFTIGTPATRSDIVKDCVKIGYFESKKGVFYPTEMAFAVMEAVGHLPIFDYKVTAEWEYNFKALQRGEEAIPEEYYLKNMHQMINQIKDDPRSRQNFSTKNTKSTDLVCPKCGKPLVGKTVTVKGEKKSVFTHAEYPNDCGFTFWRNFMGALFTEKEAKTLMGGGQVTKQLISSQGKPWKQTLTYDGTGYKFVK